MDVEKKLKKIFKGILWKACCSIKSLIRICIVTVCANLKTKGHDFTGQAVPSEECLHGVGQLDLLRKHVPQKLVEEVSRVEQGDQNTRQLVLPRGKAAMTTRRD